MNQIKITAIFVLSLILIKTIANAEDLKVSDLRKSSVRIYNPEKNSGGTGAVIKSTEHGSKILTNKHVCRLIEQGGVVNREGEDYEITHYKKFADHDLCLVAIKEQLKVNTVISKDKANISDVVYVSGHPNLLPHIVTKGHLSDVVSIKLVVGMRPCKKNDVSLKCMFFGGFPVVRKFESQVVSNLIKPGSSGSAVFNTKGEIVGVVFAGSGRNFSHGFIVPQKYIHYFLSVAKFNNYVPVGTKVNDYGIEGRVFNYNKCRQSTQEKIQTMCNELEDNLIWRK